MTVRMLRADEEVGDCRQREQCHRDQQAPSHRERALCCAEGCLEPVDGVGLNCDGALMGVDLFVKRGDDRVDSGRLLGGNWCAKPTDRL